MEGDRILRCVLDQTPSQMLVKDVENYLKPAEKSAKANGTEVTKYQAFSLKLLRCSIQAFENAKSDASYLFEACKVAVNFIASACSHLISGNNTEACELERLTKLLYHFLAQLSKIEDLDRFIWFSTKMHQFHKLGRQKQSNTQHIVSEAAKMSEKIFEMHWKSAGKASKKKELFEEVFLIRILGLRYLIDFCKDLKKFEKYFENVMLNFLHENRSQSVTINMDAGLVLKDILASLLPKLSSRSKEGANNQGTAMYLVFLSFKFLLLHGCSLQCVETLSKSLVNRDDCPNSKHYISPLIEVYKSYFILKQCSSAKATKSICKQAATLIQSLQGLEAMHLELFKAKVFLVNPKVVVFYDIFKEFLGSQEKFCWEIIGSVSGVVISLATHVDVTFVSLNGGIENGSCSKDDLMTVYKALLTQWYSFVSWCLQLFQSWLSKSSKSFAGVKCACAAKSTFKRDDLYQACCSLASSGTSALKAMADLEVAVLETEYNWLGVTTYNLGVIAQKDGSLKTSTALFENSVQNIKAWVLKATDATITRLQQTNLVFKHSILVDALLKVGSSEKALAKIVEFLGFLLPGEAPCSDSEAITELIRDQINLWIKTQGKILKGGSENGRRAITGELKGLSESDLKFVAECEMTSLTTGRAKVCIGPVKELLGLISDQFGGKDDVFVAWAMLEYASLPSDQITMDERVQMCSEVICLLEQCTSENDVTPARDLLAMAYFQLGCCQRRMCLASLNDKSEFTDKEAGPDSEAGVEDDECFYNQLASEKTDHSTLFNTALDIWTDLFQTATKANNSPPFQGLIRCSKRTATCLRYIGQIYVLNRQRFCAAQAFHLSSLLMEANSSTACERQAEALVNVTCEIARPLAEIFDFPTAMSVLSNIGQVDELEDLVGVNVQVTKAFLLQRAGENEKAISILNEVLSNVRLLQKTPKSFYAKADCLLTLALSCEHPNCSSADRHPMALAQEALKIFRNLVQLYLGCKENPSQKDHRRLQELHDVSPWTVACKLLDCLLFVAQSYQSQGCVPEARCHIKEALILCEQFSLPERKLEFLCEEAKSSLLSHDEEKAKSSILEILKALRVTSEEGKRPREVPAFYRHEDSCTCEFCTDIFLVDICFKCLVLRRHYYLITSKDVEDNRRKPVPLNEAVAKALRKATNSVTGLRNFLRSHAARKKKKVTFSGHSVKSACFTEMFDDKVACSLEPGDIAELLYYGHRIELTCMDYRRTRRSESDVLKNDAGRMLDDVRSSQAFRIISSVYRKAVAKLMQIEAEDVLSSDLARKAVECAWKFGKSMNKDGCVAAAVEISKAKTKLANDVSDVGIANESTRKKTRGGRRAKASTRKAARPASATEAPSLVTESGQDRRNEDDTQADQLLEKVRKACSEGLSLLVPQVDCLQIKAFYELLSLVTGQRSPRKTAWLEQLSFARTLHQQLLSRSIKNARKSVSDGKASCSEDEALFLEATISTVTAMNETFSFQSEERVSELLIEKLPSSWRVCSLRLSDVCTRAVLITRLQAGKQPLVVRLPINDHDGSETEEDPDVDSLVRDLASVFVTDPFEEFEEILQQSRQSLETEDVKTWWNNRKKLDTRLKKMLNKVEDQWLRGWKGLLLGERTDPAEKSMIARLAKEFCDEVETSCSKRLPVDFIEALFDGFELLSQFQVKKALEELLDSHSTENIYEMFLEKADEITTGETRGNARSTPCRRRKERTKSRRSTSTKRAPVILILDKHLQKLPWESTSILRHQQTVSRMPSLILTNLSYMLSENLVSNGLDTRNTFYVLNPRNDLQNTQATFEKWFQSDEGWMGISGRAPTEAEYKDALQSHQMFIYCGHGNGREFLRGDDIQRLNCRALTLLMGCSSGKLQVKGELDARGMALQYLMAGCPAIVANLWDVTDKDIDRFLSKLLKEWLDTDANFTDCISCARDACLLPNLIGASPVLYGLPVITKSNSR